MKVRQAVLIFAFGLAAVSFVAPTPGLTQCRLCSDPTTVHADPDGASTPLKIEVRTTLDFDRLILTSEGAGRAVLGPDSSRSGTGSVGVLSSRAVAAEVVVHGEAGRAVRVDLPSHIDLYGLKGGSVRIDSLKSDLPSNPVLDAAGDLHIRIGGELSVDGDLDGDFRGDVPVIVDYL